MIELFNLPTFFTFFIFLYINNLRLQQLNRLNAILTNASINNKKLHLTASINRQNSHVIKCSIAVFKKIYFVNSKQETGIRTFCL